MYKAWEKSINKEMFIIKVAAFFLIWEISALPEESPQIITPTLPQFYEQLIADKPSGERETYREKFRTILKETDDKLKEKDDTLKMISCHLPTNDFICSMVKMKYGITNIYNDYGITYVVGGETSCQWPSRIQTQRMNHDFCVKGNDLMYDVSGNRENQDDRGFLRWYVFVSQETHIIKFNRGAIKDDRLITPEEKKTGSVLAPAELEKRKDQLIIKYKKFAKALQGNLTKHYENLNDSQKEILYPNGKQEFLRYFAAIIQRSHRIGYYYIFQWAGRLDSEAKKKFPNGTCYTLDTALNNVMPEWYFDDEYVTMLNILQEAMGYTDSLNMFHNTATFKNAKNEEVVIPGFPNCGYFNMPVEFYASRFAPKVTSAVTEIGNITNEEPTV